VSLTAKSNAPAAVGHYDANYHNFQTELYEQIRHEAGDNIGQSSWTNTEEQDKCLAWLSLSPGKTLLDVACGSGGPVLRIAEITGCSVVGIDVHRDGVANANSLAAQRNVASRAEFQVEDATRRLPFADSSFDAITCIDAINHLQDRRGVIADWARLLKPGGRLLFTDPTTITGPLTFEEIAVRSSIGKCLFVPTGYDEQVMTECGLRVLVREDATENMAQIAQRRAAARAKRSEDLRKIEGNESYEGQQEFFTVAARIARDRRLSRFLYVAEKPA
jgi:ubiquinone/menaquinone biosynthesis C-methylase UbiE